MDASPRASAVDATPERGAVPHEAVAGPGRDHEDLVSLWPHCRLASAREAVEAMYEAYPAAPVDPYLESFVEQLSQEATS
jgi:hypothetical protein